MLLAVLADIHGNFEALRAVLADARAAGADTVLSLGDNIGYGPEPEEVIARLRAEGIASLRGNHELALISSAYRNRLNPTAQKSLAITQSLLSDSSLEYCRKLPVTRRLAGSLFVHGTPPCSVTRYLFAPAPAELHQLFLSFRERICFFGHTHNLALYGDTPEALTRLPPGDIPLRPEGRYLINVGSVGQPRDGDNHAKYVLFDTGSGRLTVRYVVYDIRAAAEKILTRGFPEYNALRLFGSDTAAAAQLTGYRRMA